MLSGAYALKLSWTGEGYAADEGRSRDMLVGIVATIYGAWLVYAAGPNYLLMCALLYAPGILIYWWARNARGERAFAALDIVLAIGIAIAAGWAGYLMWTGAISA